MRSSKHTKKRSDRPPTPGKGFDMRVVHDIIKNKNFEEAFCNGRQVRTRRCTEHAVLAAPCPCGRCFAHRVGLLTSITRRRPSWAFTCGRGLVDGAAANRRTLTWFVGALIEIRIICGTTAVADPLLPVYECWANSIFMVRVQLPRP